MFKSLSLKVILFGFIFTFFSSFGQSFFLGLFNSSIRDTLSITQGQFGTIYASSTLLSSFLLIWVGKKIDDINIFKFAFYFILNAYSIASPSVVSLFEYSLIIWAILIGYFLFDSVPSIRTLFGATIIIIAGIYIYLREKVKEQLIVSDNPIR